MTKLLLELSLVWWLLPTVAILYCRHRITSSDQSIISKIAINLAVLCYVVICPLITLPSVVFLLKFVNGPDVNDFIHGIIACLGPLFCCCISLVLYQIVKTTKTPYKLESSLSLIRIPVALITILALLSTSIGLGLGLLLFQLPFLKM